MKQLIILLCVTLSFTSLSFFKLGQAEFTLFHALALLTILFFFLRSFIKMKFTLTKPHFFLLALIYLSAVNLFYIDDIKLTSFIYSLVILFEMLLLYNCVKSLSTANIKTITKTIIGFYFVNIIIASVFIWLKIKPPGILDQIFKIYIFDSRVRPYGFSDEPSYASLILVFALYVLFKTDEFKYRSTEFNWYFLAVLTIVLTGSSYGLMMLALLLLYFILKSNVVVLKTAALLNNRLLKGWQLIIILLLVLFPVMILLKNIDISNNKSVKRLVDLYQSIEISDDEVAKTIKHIAYVDGSASMRLVPTVLLMENFSHSERKYVLFGHGAGQSVPFFSKFYKGEVTILGFLPSFIYNYGVAGTILFLCLFLSFFPKKRWLLIILFILAIFNADFNTQIFLFILFCVMCTRQVEINVTNQNTPLYASH